ncbi:MAG: hypothetical protein R3F22_12435 [Lysobacteraceae bacterium]
MTILRCTAKLLKRLKQPTKPPEPLPQGNPLGEWYADVDFWHRKPFVVMINAATGIVLVLNGNAAGLRVLHERAVLQFASLCEHFGVRGAGVDAELCGFDDGFVFGKTQDRSLLGTLNGHKDMLWTGFEYHADSLVEGAARQWNGLFKHPSIGPNIRKNMKYHRPLDLLKQHLNPAAEIIPFPS